ncbi:UNVERIFIED_CONTAM: hypothetical protein GTU68_065578 [Idotea baltica]|nr:hypothetical protein [Idotea baltica]
MLPIVDKPTIQYVVEEAVASGITDILMVIGKGKRAIEEHFDRSFELELALEEKKKMKELEAIRKITNLADIHFIWQKELNGLGDAVRYGQSHVGNEPFVVLLGDTIMESHNKRPICRQLIDTYEKYKSSVVAMESVDPKLVYRYGVMGGKEIDSGIFQVEEWVEKPEPEDAPSNLVIAGRYLFTPDIFDYLKIIPRGKNNEIQLTDAMSLMLKEKAMYGLHFDGKRHDIGNKMDFIRTNLLFGLKRKDMTEELTAWVKELAESL